MVVFFILSFFIGSFPSAHIISSLQGVDIKKAGSGNAGATNVLRSVGWKSGILVLILDVGKGILPFLLYPFFSEEKSLLNADWIPIIGGFLAVLGHIFNPFMKFDGGKGIATSVGLYLYILPIPCIMSGILGAIILYWKKIASLGSIVGFFFLPIFYLIYMGDSFSPKVLSLVIINFFLVLFTHRQNLKRIIDGTELSFKNKSNGN
ncbi:MAG: glycerol-3-phosphate 1-O-acyltransferase PlsY [Leptospiraceae bacterium]|nr:glycerol-3-phosphate 1-O-acyltransferase PlsY [Leptospiraceae bacterium]